MTQPTPPYRRHIHVRLSDPLGVAYKGAILTLHFLPAQTGTLPRIASYEVVNDCRQYTTNISGYVRLDLLPNDDLQPGSRYQLDILTLHGTKRYVFTVKREDPLDLEWADLIQAQQRQQAQSDCVNYLESTWN